MTESERDAIVDELRKIELTLNDRQLSQDRRFALLGAAAGLRWFLERDLWETPSESLCRMTLQ